MLFRIKGSRYGIWAASLAALVGAGISAVIVERLAYKPIRVLITLYMLIASMGMSIVIENFRSYRWRPFQALR